MQQPNAITRLWPPIEESSTGQFLVIKLYLLQKLLPPQKRQLHGSLLLHKSFGLLFIVLNGPTGISMSTTLIGLLRPHVNGLIFSQSSQKLISQNTQPIYSIKTNISIRSHSPFSKHKLFPLSVHGSLNMLLLSKNAMQHSIFPTPLNLLLYDHSSFHPHFLSMLQEPRSILLMLKPVPLETYLRHL